MRSNRWSHIAFPKVSRFPSKALPDCLLTLEHPSVTRRGVRMMDITAEQRKPIPHIYNATLPLLRHSSCTRLFSSWRSQACLLYYTRPQPHLEPSRIVYEKFLVKFWTMSFSLPSRSLLSAPSLSICSMVADSLVFMWLRKSASHCRILLTGILSR